MAAKIGIVGGGLALVTAAALAPAEGGKAARPKAWEGNPRGFGEEGGCATSGNRFAQPALSYNRDIRPILIENCFTARTDSGKRAAGLRLDDRSETIAGSDRALQAGTEPDDRPHVRPGRAVSPPVSTHKQLTPAQKALLKRGSPGEQKYEAHWSLVPLPARTKVPTVKMADWCGGPIDGLCWRAWSARGSAPPSRPAAGLAAPGHLRSHRPAADARGDGKLRRGQG